MPEKKVDRKAETRKKILKKLNQAYWAEIETVINYLANSTHLDGIRAEEIKKALAADVQEELGHAQQIAGRIKVLGGSIPGSAAFKATQTSLQPPADSTDVVAVIEGVIDAENEAIEMYTQLVELCDGVDYVTQDLAVQLLGDEEEHRRTFQGFLAEYRKR